MSDMRVATTFYELMKLEWMSENTRLYHIVRTCKSIDLSGDDVMTKVEICNLRAPCSVAPRGGRG